MIKKGYIYSIDSVDDKERLFMTFNYKKNYFGRYCTSFRINLETGKAMRPVLDVFHGDSGMAHKLVREGRYDSDEVMSAIVEYFSEYLGFFKEKVEVLYEEFEGIDGIRYGRELLTGLVFPIGTKENLEKNTLYHRVEKDGENKCFNFLVSKKYVCEVDSMHRVGAFIAGESLRVTDNNDVANNNDIDAYTNMKDTFFKRYRTKIIDKINLLYNTNVFKYEIVENKKVKEEKKVEQDKETIIMEKIEYLLVLLEKIDKDLFNKYNDRYNNIINGEEDLLKLESLNITNLILLQSELELELEYKKRNVNNLNDYINSLRIDYLNKLNGEEVTPISLKDLDRLYELFINIKNDFNLIDRRSIINNISFLYLMELYENRDSISIDELNNSYCTDIIRSILINLKSLINIGLFENNIELELNNDVNVEMLFNIINSLKIKEKDKVKLLIKE